MDTLATSNGISDTSQADTIVVYDTLPTEVEIRELLPGDPIELGGSGSDPTWLFLYVVVYLGLAGFLRLNNYSLFQYRLKAFLNYHLATQFFRDLDLQGSPLHLVYNLHLLMGFSLLGYLLVQAWFPMPAYPDHLILGAILGAATSLFILRALLVRIIGAVFGISDTVVFAQFVSNIHYSTLAWVYMPVLVVAAFAGPQASEWAIRLSLVLLAILVIIRYYRGFQVARDFFRDYKVPLSLYICSIELAPLLIIYQGIFIAYRLITG